MAQRIVALPIPARDYTALASGKAGQIYLLESIPADLEAAGQSGDVLSKFDLKTRKVEKLSEGVSAFDLSANGEKMLLGTRRGTAAQWSIVPANAPVKASDGALRLAGMEVRVDPVAEWKQMYHEVWRIERSYFYDPNLHGLDANAEEKKYEPYLDSLTSRDDLNYLFQEMLANITSSHLRGGGGTVPRGKPVPGGLLGADYEIVNGKYRLRKIYTGVFRFS